MKTNSMAMPMYAQDPADRYTDRPNYELDYTNRPHVMPDSVLGKPTTNQPLDTGLVLVQPL